MTTKEITTTAAGTPPRLQMSYEAYWAWADEDVHAEWVNGEVIVHMPPFEEHQTVLNFVNRLLSDYVEFEKLGVVQVAPFEMRLPAQNTARQPDILVITNESQEHLSRERLEGPADLVVEVVSRDSVRRDRQEKYREYEAAGVREYWIIDPRPGKNLAFFYRLDEQGQYELYATEDDEWVESKVLPGFRLRPAWLWPDRPPAREAFYKLLSAEQQARFRQLYIGGASTE